MATKSAPIRRRPRRAPARPDGLSARKVSEWVGLILAVLSIVTVGYNQLQSHWKKDQQAEQQAAALALLKTDTEKEIATAKADVAKDLGVLGERVAKAEAHADSIDKTGTDYGRNQYSTQSVERQQLKKDVQDLQSVTDELRSGVTEIKVNVRWLMANAGAPDAVSAAEANPRLHPRDGRPRGLHRGAR